MIEGF